MYCYCIVTDALKLNQDPFDALVLARDKIISFPLLQEQQQDGQNGDNESDNVILDENSENESNGPSVVAVDKSDSIIINNENVLNTNDSNKVISLTKYYANANNDSLREKIIAHLKIIMMESK